MDQLTLIKLIFWLAANLHRQLLLDHYLQVKEYRLDRFFIFAKSPDGFKHLQIYSLIAKLFIFFSPYPQLIFAILILESAGFVGNILSHQFRRPQLSIRGKNFILTSAGFILLAGLFLYTRPQDQLFLKLDLASYAIPFLALAWTQTRFNQALKKETALAVAKLNLVKPKVIAITGSYAKSSTKHLLHHLLSSHLNSLATPASHNTSFGIVRTINSSLKKTTTHFIAEMGAYKKGEVKALTQITPPHTSLITGIAPQHLELFGSHQNLLQAKYEITCGLKKSSPLFINTSKSSTAPLVKKAKKERRLLFTYALGRPANYSSQITRQTKKLTCFSLKTPSKKYTYTAPSIPPHLVENLTGALAVADYLKIPQAKLKKAIANLPANLLNLRPIRLSPAINLINDSHNSNPQGFRSAVNYLCRQPGFKAVVTPGIIELGKKSKSLHQQFGRLLKKTDLILLTNPQFTAHLQKGLGSHSHKLHLVTPQNTRQKLALIQKPAVVLLEGRLPAGLKTTIFKLK